MQRMPAPFIQQNPKTENRKPETGKPENPKTRKPKTENRKTRKPKTENRKPKTENRKSKTETGKPKNPKPENPKNRKTKKMSACQKNRHLSLFHEFRKESVAAGLRISSVSAHDNQIISIFLRFFHDLF